MSSAYIVCILADRTGTQQQKEEAIIVILIIVIIIIIIIMIIMIMIIRGQAVSFCHLNRNEREKIV
jgi:flagellar basal body-associated protein FliL